MPFYVQTGRLDIHDHNLKPHLEPCRFSHNKTTELPWWWSWRLELQEALKCREWDLVQTCLAWQSICETDNDFDFGFSGILRRDGYTAQLRTRGIGTLERVGHMAKTVQSAIHESGNRNRFMSHSTKTSYFQ